ncbi:MAG: cell division protein ZapA [Clostridiales Family XIII bacterium]|jgi:cell division protein ZapA|nr:cell division protein ZapA [Clostridiales Family XIII bacterium]
MSDATKVTVKIYNKEYVIAGEKPREYIEKLAAYVDQVMQTIGRSAIGGAASEVATLACLNIADEYHVFMDEHEDSGKEKIKMQKEIAHYTQLWEDAKKNFLQYKDETSAALAQKDKLQQKLNEKSIENDNLLKATVTKDEKIADLEGKLVQLAQKLKTREESAAISDEQGRHLEDAYKELEGNFFELQMENIQLKGELDRIRKQEG